MGILKTTAKVLGTATLSATWLASGMLKTASDAAGFDLGSELFGMGNEASASGIKQLWNVEEPEMSDIEAETSALDKERMAKIRAASKCYAMASTAKKAGDMEKYEMLMQRYEDLRAEAEAYSEEISQL